MSNLEYLFLNSESAIAIILFMWVYLIIVLFLLYIIWPHNKFSN